MKYVPKEVSEEINVTRRHPLANFAYLLGTVVLLSLLIFIALGYAASYITSRISPETEAKIGQMLADIVVEDELKDDKRIHYLKELLDSLTDDVNETVRLPLKIHLLDNEIVNAAIMPGGHVLIYTGFLKQMRSENELALVLAHELGHFQARDPLESLGRSLVLMVASTFLGISTAESGGVSNIVLMTSDLTELNYSRKQESAADLYGLTKIIKHYGHGGHSLDFFAQLAAEEEQELVKVSGYFLTHPPSKERIKKLNVAAAKKGWEMAGELTLLPEWLRCPNMEPCD